MAIQATIKDVARESGVSIGTVDRVLHNRGRVSPEKIQAVLAAVEKLNYTPSKVARALATSKNSIKIGITYPNVDNAFWSEIDCGIAKARESLDAFGIELIIEPTYTYNPSEQIEVIDRLVAQGVNGILLTSVEGSTPERIESHIPSDIVYATVVNVTYGGRRAFHIGPDDYSLGTLAARLTSFYCGNNAHVLIVSPNYDFTGMQQRIAGFVCKVKFDFPEMNILRTLPIPSGTKQELFDNIYNCTAELLRSYPSANSLYIPCGLFDYAAAAVKDTGRSGEVTVIGHEYTASLHDLPAPCSTVVCGN